MNLEGTTIEEGLHSLSLLRRVAPFRFSGRWHIAVINGEVKAYRSLSKIKKAAAKAGIQSLPIASI